MSGFTALRQTRQSRQTASFASRQTPVTQNPPPAEPHESALWTANDIPASEALYRALGEKPDQETGWEIRVSPKTGRGIYVSQDHGKSVKPGNTIVRVLPHAHALSTRCLALYCTFCQKEPSVDDAGQPQPLKRCARCKIVWYDSAACQNADWAIHRLECAALQAWSNAAFAALNPSNDAQSSSSSSISSGADASKAVERVPSEAVRVLGRLLWGLSSYGLDSTWARELALMQSHRSSLDPKSPAHISLTSLAHSLARYVSRTPDMTQDQSSNFAGGFSKWGIRSPADLVDFLSKFTTNSFTLTTPSLSPVGVAISPLIALVNHSCVPNAVVVFPNTGGTTMKPSPSEMKLVAIKDIKPGEEILTSYIDISQTRILRIKELRENYFFECECSACSTKAGDGGEADVRQAIKCQKCGTNVWIPDEALPESNEKDEEESGPITCAKCNHKVVSTIHTCHDALQLGREGLAAATACQFTDIPRALKYTTSTLAHFSQTLPTLHIASDPLLSLTRLHLSLLIASLPTEPPSSLQDQISYDTLIDDACRVAARVVGGLSGIFQEGHPVRGVALAELGKLLCVDVGPLPVPTSPSSSLSGRGEDGDGPLPRGPERLQMAAQVLIRARTELEVGFGKDSGGDVGRQVQHMLSELEREAEVWRRAGSGRLMSA